MYRLITWEDVLKRTDLLNGDLLITRGCEYTRGPIKSLVHDGKKLSIECSWMAHRQSTIAPWIYMASALEHSFIINMESVKVYDIGLQRLFFSAGDTSWHMFPAQGSQLDTNDIEGFPNEKTGGAIMSRKSLILIHEGKPDHLGRLSEEGADAMKRTAEALNLIGLWNGGRFKFLSSHSTRCFESAQALAKQHWVADVTTTTLAHQNGCDDFEPLLQLLNQQWEEAEIIIFMTHREICHRFPAYLLEKMHNLRPPIIGELSYGEGIVIDMANGAVSRLISQQ